MTQRRQQSKWQFALFLILLSMPRAPSRDGIPSSAHRHAVRSPRKACGNRLSRANHEEDSVSVSDA
jgi:hypothetical protein